MAVYSDGIVVQGCGGDGSDSESNSDGRSVVLEVLLVVCSDSRDDSKCSDIYFVGRDNSIQ